jgi:hypothetical protein
MKKNYIIVDSQNVWHSTGKNATPEEIASDVQILKDDLIEQGFTDIKLYVYEIVGEPQEILICETFTEEEIQEFKKEWGQSHREICSNLGYSKKGSDDLLIMDYFWIEKSKQWYPKCNSCYTEQEQKIANFLRHT